MLFHRYFDSELCVSVVVYVCVCIVENVFDSGSAHERFLVFVYVCWVCVCMCGCMCTQVRTCVCVCCVLIYISFFNFGYENAQMFSFCRFGCSRGSNGQICRKCSIFGLLDSCA